MDPTEGLIKRIHDSPWRLVLVATGGGTQAVADLLRVPGASRTLLEAVIPYSMAALQRFLKKLPHQACCEATARALAVAAFLRACELVPERGQETQLAGVACTASLATDRPKKGPHRLYLAVQRLDVTRSFSLQLIKGARNRAEEEQVAAKLFLHAIATACGMAPDWPLDLLPGEILEHQSTEAPESWQKLLLGELDVVGLGTPLDWQRGRPAVLFPGAFHPLHTGHQRMAQIAEAKLGRPVEFEIAISNVDKPPLDYCEIRHRVEQFSLQDRIWLTRLPTFVEKARRFPQATFVVGIDTLLRIADPSYYGQDSGARDRAIQELVERGCRFLVFGRFFKGRFWELNNVTIPDPLRAICEGVKEAEFREDVSSTRLRHQTAAEDR